MFYFIPMTFNYVIILYILAAVVPAIFLMRYIYKHDTVEKEPPYLLWSLVVCGVAAALCSIALEWLGNIILDVSVSQDSRYYVLILAFLVVAAVEEGTKLFANVPGPPYNIHTNQEEIV